jgi:hypothetical protein
MLLLANYNHLWKTVDAIFWSGDVASSETSPSPAPWPAKQERPAGGWPAGPPPTIKSVKCLYREERERERERERDLLEIIDSALIILILPFYTHVCHMLILPLSSMKLCVDVLCLL